MDLDVITDNMSIALYTVTVIVGTVGNSLVLWVAGFILPSKITNVWIANLAVSNLIFCLTRAMPLIKRIFFDHWPFGVFLCKFTGFFKYTNMFCSAFMLVVICVDRTLIVRRPLFTKQHRTLLAARVISLVVWVAASIMSAPYFFYRDVQQGKNNLSKCSIEVKGAEDDNKAEMGLYSIRFLCAFLLPFLVCSVLCTYLDKIRKVRVRQHNPSGSPFIKILIAMVFTFFMCWMPYHCLLLVKMTDGKTPEVKVGLTLSKGIAYFSSCINPIFYIGMGLDVKRMISGAAYRRAAPAPAEDEDEEEEAAGQMTQMQVHRHGEHKDRSGTLSSNHTDAQVHGNSSTDVTPDA